MARKAKVDVNTADRDELAAVPGIGRSTAEAMVRLRFERGGFKRIDELAEVPGIGEQTLEGLRRHVTVSINGEAQARRAEKSATGVDRSASAAGKGTETAPRSAEEGVASAAEGAEAGADAAKESAAVQAEVSAEQAESTAAVRRSAQEHPAQEHIETAHARQQRTVEVATTSGNAVLESVREASQAWLGLVQDQIWANVQTAQMLARCRSPQDVLEVQSTYVRSSLERLAEEQARFADLATRMATRAFRPFEAKSR